MALAYARIAGVWCTRLHRRDLTALTEAYCLTSRRDGHSQQLVPYRRAWSALAADKTSFSMLSIQKLDH
eukprot:1152536-Pelagomonas_calceolata.AAC.1